MLAPSAAAKKGPNSQTIVVAERTFIGNAIPSRADFRITGLFVVIRIMTIGIRTPSAITTAPVYFSTGRPRPRIHSLRSCLISMLMLR